MASVIALHVSGVLPGHLHSLHNIATCANNYLRLRYPNVTIYDKANGAPTAYSQALLGPF
ncbi:hypothetical protein AG0111_0g951 [Alternaria gaisen]|uniref:Uncharacterized protein n=1 Tax=Alternaria gaisen TaxID=167740 RepID=A0ACB6G2T5_9PLEO|nr:hypothetical protein AG0111_0g951 [Alternaria gaisen]